MSASPKPWSALTPKEVPDSADYFAIVDSADGTNKSVAFGGILSFIGKANNDTGWTLAGGTSSKSLTITEDSTIDQNIQSTQSVSWLSVSASGLTGAASASRYVGATASGAPAAGTFSIGDYVIARDGAVYICTAAGTPGTWVNAGASGNLVTSVFGRTGAIVAAIGDYSQSQITGLKTSDSPTFAGMTATGSINAANGAALTATTGISFFSGSANYRVGFDNNSSTRGWIRSNVDTNSSIHGWVFTSGSITDALSASALLQSNSTFILGANAQSITPLAALHIANTGYFGGALSTASTFAAADSIAGNKGWIAGHFGGVSGDRVVMGNFGGVALFGAHTGGLDAWADLYMMPANTANIAIGLSYSQTPNAKLHSSESTILGVAASAVADANIYTNQANIWEDATNNILHFKSKNAGGIVHDYQLNLSDSSNYQTVIVTSEYLADSSDFVILCDTTTGGFIVYVDATKIAKEQIIMNYLGVGELTIYPVGGQVINNSVEPIILTSVGQFVRLTSNGLANMYCSGSNDSYRTITTNSTNNSNDKLILIDADSTDVTLSVDVTKLINPLRVVKINKTGGNVAGIQALSGQTINEVDTLITFATKYSCAEISYIGGTAGCITAVSIG
jgi:hypothetical protein